MNSYAQKFVERPEELNEKKWVALLYQMRGKPMPEDLFDSPI